MSGNFTFYLVKPKGATMDNYTAIGLAEGFIEPESEEQVIEAWQHLINTGLCWTLQGWFGRTAQSLIEQGICQNPRQARNEASHPTV